MPVLKARPPKYCPYRDGARITIQGTTHYLPGKFNSDDSLREYRRLIAQWAARIRRKGSSNRSSSAPTHIILSGHRRFVAAQLAGLRTVPCRKVSISRADNPDGFLRVLREYNRQRVKSFAEVVREEVLDINAEEAHERLLSQRAEKSEVRYPKLSLGA